MTTIDPQAPVFVTGATGYVAGWLVKKLLEAGHTVHAAVRDPVNTAKRAHLDAIARASAGTIRYFQSDLLQPGSFDEGMAGCELVFHTASPFTSAVSDPVRDLIEPAHEGTRNVLDAVNRTPSVKRVVLTSSCAAIYGDNADLDATPNGVFTEEIWNTSSSVDHQAYSYSKTLAERAAWDMANAQDRWDLVVMNPALVLGPGLQDRPTSESFNQIRSFGTGDYKMGTPRLGVGVVGVRDLADAHYKAGFTPDAHGRNIIVGHNSDLQAFATILKNHYGDKYPISDRPMPKWLLWLVGPLANEILTRKVIGLNVNRPWRADNRKAIRELGMSYRPLKDSLVDMMDQMEAAGQFRQD